MLAINNYQIAQQPSFKSKGNNLSKAEKKAFRAMEDLEISRIMNDPRMPVEQKKHILQNKMVQRLSEDGFFKTMKNTILKAIIKK